MRHRRLILEQRPDNLDPARPGGEDGAAGKVHGEVLGMRAEHGFEPRLGQAMEHAPHGIACQGDGLPQPGVVPRHVQPPAPW